MNWDIEEIKKRLRPNTQFHRNGQKPLGFVGNMAISGNNKFLMVEGSLAEYFMKDNVQNFEWKHVKPAIKMLAHDLGLPIQRGILRRLDISYNFKMLEPVIEYFPELIHLRFYQRLDNETTTLRFMKNDYNINVIFYDKLAQAKRKRIPDEYLINLAGTENLLRYEVQLQQGLSKTLEMKKVKVVHLYRPCFYMELLNHWYRTFINIERKAILDYPRKKKGMPGFKMLVMRRFVEENGWNEIETILERGVKNGTLTYNEKSLTLKQLREIMLNTESFVFKDHTMELAQKIREVYEEQEEKINNLKNGF